MLLSHTWSASSSLVRIEEVISHQIVERSARIKHILQDGASGGCRLSKKMYCSWSHDSRQSLYIAYIDSPLLLEVIDVPEELSWPEELSFEFLYPAASDELLLATSFATESLQDEVRQSTCFSFRFVAGREIITCWQSWVSPLSCCLSLSSEGLVSLVNDDDFCVKDVANLQAFNSAGSFTESEPFLVKETLA